MATKQVTQSNLNNKPYSLRRFRSKTTTSDSFESTTSQAVPATKNETSQDSDSTDTDTSEHTMDIIDNIPIYSFSSMEKLKLFCHNRKQIKLADKNSQQNPEAPPQNPEMNRFLQRLDDNLTSDRADIVWQPDIKRTRARKTNQRSSLASDLSDLPECGKAHCKLGCICDDEEEDASTSDTNESGRQREHCGKVECMFVCNCTRKLRSGGGQRQTRDSANKKQMATKKPTQEGDDNRRISKRIKSAISKIKRVNLGKAAAAAGKAKTAKSKSILNSSICSQKSTNSNLTQARSSSEESLELKEKLSGPNCSSDDYEVNPPTVTNTSDETCVTRKSKRVKTVNRKYIPDPDPVEAIETPEQPEAFNYRPAKSKVLNNRLNENCSPKKDKTPVKSTVVKESKKSIVEAKPDTLSFKHSLPETVGDENTNQSGIIETTSTSMLNQPHRPFNSYTRRISLKITNNRGNSLCPTFSKLPLSIQIFTPIWDNDHELRLQVLRQIAKLLQNNIGNWTHLDFECDSLAIKLINSSPVQVKAYTNTKINSATSLTNEQKLSSINLTELVSTSQMLRSQLDKHKPADENSSCKSNAVYKNQNQVPPLVRTDTENTLLLNGQSSPQKSLPRLLCRKRSSKQFTELTTNKTGQMLKHIDTLFPQLNSLEPVKHINETRPVDDLSKVSLLLHELRTGSVTATECLYQDEIEYLKHCPTTEDGKFPFYNPFVDEELILGIYKENGSRDVVDTVCDVMNDMITACCKLNEKSSNLKEVKKSNGENEIVKVKPICQTNSTSPNVKPLSNLNSAVKLTTVKSTPIIPKLSSFQPICSNTAPTKKSLVYQIINSSELKKKNLISLIKTSTQSNTSSSTNSPYPTNPSSSPSPSPSSTSTSSSDAPPAQQQQATTNRSPILTNISPDTNINKQISTFKFDDNLEELENELANTAADSQLGKQIREDKLHISAVKTILPSCTAGVTPKYKTFVKIITPEKNRPESGPKIRISSSYLMPARSQEPLKKLIIPANRDTYISSFVPIRPRNQEIPQGNNNKQNAMITLVAPNASKRMSSEMDSSSKMSNESDNQDQISYVEARKRKRKQDLSSLRCRAADVSADEETASWTEASSELARIRSGLGLGEDKFFTQCERTHIASALGQVNSPVRHPKSTLRMHFPSNNKIKRGLKTSNFGRIIKYQNKLNYTITPPPPTKNFSSSPDSNESFYSNALVQYKEDSDEDEFPDDSYFSQTRTSTSPHTVQHYSDQDVIEIDSFDPTERDYYADDVHHHQHSQPDDNANDSDSSDSSLPSISFKCKGLEKSTINNLHSIRERQRRLKLKNLLMKLKIQLFECESDCQYLLDDSVSQMKLDEYCNTRNFNKKNLKSKQNILQEAVYLISNLQEKQKILEKLREERRLELEKNIGIRNYLLSLQNEDRLSHS